MPVTIERSLVPVALTVHFLSRGTAISNSDGHKGVPRLATPRSGDLAFRTMTLPSRLSGRNVTLSLISYSVTSEAVSPAVGSTGSNRASPAKIRTRFNMSCSFSLGSSSSAVTAPRSVGRLVGVNPVHAWRSRYARDRAQCGETRRGACGNPAGWEYDLRLTQGRRSARHGPGTASTSGVVALTASC